VADEPAGFDLVDVLAARTGRRGSEFFDVLGVDVDLDVREFGENRDRGGRRVDAAGRLGFGDALNAVPAALEAQPAEGAVFPDGDDRFLEAGRARDRRSRDGERPAPGLTVARYIS